MPKKLILPTFCLSLFACSSQQSPTYTKISGETMGTSYHITFELPAGVDANTIQASIDKRLSEINQSMSTYQDDSTIMAFNRLGAGKTMQIDDDFIHVINDSRQVYQASGGSFDPTVHPLVELWGFGKNMSIERLEKPPTEQEINAIKDKIGFNKIILNGKELSKTNDGVSLDFSAIAKGYGVDVIANTIKNYKIQNFMVEIGGEVATSGTNDKGKPWTLAIDKPIIGSSVQNREIMTTINLSGQSIATSGNYRNVVEWQGVRYSHTINPATAHPVAGGVPSVSVIAETTSIADAWATALTALPEKDAIHLAETKHIKAIFIVHDGKDDKGSDKWRMLNSSEMTKFLAHRK